MQDSSDKNSQNDEELKKRVETFMGGVPPDEFPEEILEGKTKKGGLKDMLTKTIKGAPPVMVEPSKAVEPEPEKPEPKPEPKPPEPPTKDESEAEDQATAAAVDDIVRHEGDEVLAAEDAEVSKAFEPKKTDWKSKLKDFWKRWWTNPKTRWGTIIGLVAVVIGLFVFPATRYFLLNTAGVRSSASVKVLDNSTQLPLKNVEVSLAGQTATTDNEGNVTLTKLKLGKTELVVKRVAFAEIRKKMTVGWGSNPLGEFKLSAVGTQYSFVAKDWLSGKPIEKAEAISGLASAFSDAEGKILLTVDETEASVLKVTVKAETYRDEEFELPLGAVENRDVNLVPGRKHVFVTKRGGHLDVYKIDADGKNEELLLKGTGSERSDIALVPHPSKEVAAFVSTRDNTRNKDGYLLSTLTVLDLTTKTSSSVTQSERVQIIGWIDTRLVFVKIAAGASASNPKRYRLMSYDYESGNEKEIAAGNHFNDAIVVGNYIYYAPSSYLSTSGTSFYKVNADGTGRQTILDKEVWSIFRTAFDKLNLSVGDEWYDYKPGENGTTKASGPPSNMVTRLYTNSPDGKFSIWTEMRDGKGVLLAYDLENKTDIVLKTIPGLTNPLRWLNNSNIIYRVQTSSETADYVVNINGGEPRKIIDVTATTGLEQWYY